MPTRYAIHKERRLVLTIAEGRVTSDEVKSYYDRLQRDPDFDADFDHLADYTAATELDMSADAVRVLAERCVFSRQSRRAFVATRPALFGMLRVMEAHHEGRSQVRVFYRRDEALKWLGITDDSGLF
jgi:hypothetical protein